MLFTELNTKVLLDIYEYLDLIDAINLAGTCVRLRDVAQRHYGRYKIFNLRNFLWIEGRMARLNYVDAASVLKCIGPFISVLVTDIDENIIGSNVGKSIRKYCVNIKSLKVCRSRYFHLSYTYIPYTEWLNNLKLEKITLSISDLLLMDLSGTTTLEELHIHGLWRREEELLRVLQKILERNSNISSLHIGSISNVDYEILAKFRSPKSLCLRIGVDRIEKVAASLKMTDLESVEIRTKLEHIDKLNIFLKKLTENALKLKDLSIDIDEGSMPNDYPLASLFLFKLTSLRLAFLYRNVHTDVAKMQPNLKHLDLVFLDIEMTTQQIIYLIKKLENLEIFHVEMLDEHGLYVHEVLDNLRNDLVIREIIDGCSITRPTLRLYVKYIRRGYYGERSKHEERDILQVKLNFNERKYTVTDIPFKLNYFSDSVEHQSLLPCCY